MKTASSEKPGSPLDDDDDDYEGVRKGYKRGRGKAWEVGSGNNSDGSNGIFARLYSMGIIQTHIVEPR